MGLESKLQVIEPTRANAIGRTPRTQNPGRTILLEGHLDTAPIGTAERKLWKFDPFSGHVDNGRVFGKGIVDMKGGLTANLTAIKAILESGVKLKGCVKLAAFADEEGYMQGVKYFIRSGQADDVNACISSEPHWGIQTSMGGRTWGRITVMGHSTTSGVDPDFAFKAGLGNNAIHQAALLLNELRKRRPASPANKLFRRSWWHVLKIQGGWDPENAPMCPESCEMILEGRLVPGQSIESFWHEVRGIIMKLQKQSPGFHAQITVLEKRPSYSIRPDHPLVKTMVRHYRRVIGSDPEMNPFRYPMNATSDAHYLADYGIPCVTFGPLEPRKVLAKQMFIADESLSVGRVVDAAKIIALATAEYLA